MLRLVARLTTQVGHRVIDRYTVSLYREENWNFPERKGLLRINFSSLCLLHRFPHRKVLPGISSLSPANKERMLLRNLSGERSRLRLLNPACNRPAQCQLSCNSPLETFGGRNNLTESVEPPLRPPMLTTKDAEEA